MDSDAYSLTELRSAVRRGQTAAVEEALDAEPAAAHAPSLHGGSLLLEAHERELTEIAELFLRSREDRGTVDLDVHEAASLGRAGLLIRALTSDPLGSEASGPDGFLPLHRAAYRGHVDATRLLLEAGADPNARSQNAASMTSLHSVAAGARRAALVESAFLGSDHAETARLLLAAGGNPLAEMEGGSSADLTRIAEPGDGERRDLDSPEA